MYRGFLFFLSQDEAVLDNLFTHEKGKEKRRRTGKLGTWADAVQEVPWERRHAARLAPAASSPCLKLGTTSSASLSSCGV